MGQLATSHYQAGLLIGLMQVLKDALGARGGLLTNGANTKGACQAGFLPMCGPGGSAIDNEGRHAKDLLSSDAAISAYFLLNLEPGYDSVLGETATKALKQADMVVAMTPFVTNYLSENATVILPVNAFAETSGRYSNVTGETQTFQAVSRAPGQSRPAWKVIRVLANFMKKDGFDFVSSEEVAAELDALVQPNQNLSVDVSFDGMSLQASEGYQIIRPVPTYGTDMLVRQAPALQETNVMKTQVQRVQISEVLAKKLGVTEDEEVVLTLNGQSVTSRVRVGGDIAPNTVSVYQAVAHLLPLAGDGKLELKKA